MTPIYTQTITNDKFTTSHHEIN